MPHSVAKFAGAFLLAGTVSAFLFTHDYRKADQLEFDGFVTSIEWNSHNHGLALVQLRTRSGVQQVQQFRLEISSDLKVGDHFKKEAGAQVCTINGTAYVCVH